MPRPRPRTAMLPPKPPEPAVITGEKLEEAAVFAQAARRAVMLWAQETCANADSMEREAPNVQKALSLAAQLEKARAELGWMARAYGYKGPEEEEQKGAIR